MPQEWLNLFVPALLGVPLAAAIVAVLLGPQRGQAVRALALTATLINVVLAAILIAHFPADRRLTESQDKGGGATFKPAMTTTWKLIRLSPAESKDDSGPMGSSIGFHVGLDGLNLWLVALTALLMVSAVLGSWTAIQERVNEFYAWLLLLEMAMLGVFISFDIILFYVFFELTLVPLFFLIGIWGGPQRQHAARKFFIFTLAGSLITLLGVLGIVLACYSREQELTFQIPRLVEIVQERLALASAEERTYWLGVQFWVFLALSTGFAVKVPLVPVHTWLPLAHVEAPTAGSVLLAGVLLKIGTYGFLRLCIPLAPDVSLSLGAPLLGSLAVIGIIYGAFCALGQDDIKKLVAYSSVSHLGLCMLGLFALNEVGIAGGLMQMINHGLSTGALFLLVGMLYERYHTRKMADYGGMAAKLKLMAVFMVFITLSSIGLPFLNGFIGEALVLMGAWDMDNSHIHGPTLAVLAASGMLLGAWYMLTMVKQVFFGAYKEPHHAGSEPVGDLNKRELAALVPIALLCVFIGVNPQPLLDRAKPEIRLLSQFAQKARDRSRLAENKSTQPEDQGVATAASGEGSR